MSQPNDALRDLIQEASCSHAGLARRINELGWHQGVNLRYDYTSVHRWVTKGERPRKPESPN